MGKLSAFHGAMYSMTCFDRHFGHPISAIVAIPSGQVDTGFSADGAANSAHASPA